VATGLVIEQLPRAGDTALTGSPAALVVSMGPGLGGKPVPSLVGRPLTVARSKLASATLFVSAVRAVGAKDVADGVVVDQAPSAGLVVPVSSGVTLAVATKAARP
jgi:beta-lactam-binding protein with PASTA domain